MKRLKILTIGLFVLIVLLPVILFNFEPNAVSEIDNRMLQENPFCAQEREKGGDLTEKIVNYVNDRIGLRSQMIRGYTVLHETFFGELGHPSYFCGKNGYIFGNGLSTSTLYSDYHEAFADMVAAIQTYCAERSVPFLFVFEPAKPAVLQEFLPDGINYDRTWVSDFLCALDERGVRYLDNTAVLQEKTAAGEDVFNRKYDANHWNDLGAYYGVNAMLKELQKDFPALHENQLNDFTQDYVTVTALPNSEVPIREEIPEFSIVAEWENRTDLYDAEVYRDPSYRGFGYFRNEKMLAEGAPKTLVFQGSYMNGKGAKYLANRLGEYIYVHDYQNVLNFDYYFQIFQPECVIFEVAEYTFSNKYFDFEQMKQVHFNPVLPDRTPCEELHGVLRTETVSIQEGEQLTTICWTGASGNEDAVWAVLGNVFDMKKTEEGYQLTVENEVWQRNKEHIQIVAKSGESWRIYQ